jgi:hypothetical protein
MNRFCRMFSQLLQLGHAHSLREITQGLKTYEGKVIHLGMTAPPDSSMLTGFEHPQNCGDRANKETGSEGWLGVEIVLKS